TSCQERAAVAPGDTLVELLHRVHARTGRRADTLAEAAAQVQTPRPLSAASGAEEVLPAAALSAPAASDPPAGPPAPAPRPAAPWGAAGAPGRPAGGGAPPRALAGRAPPGGGGVGGGVRGGPPL